MTSSHSSGGLSALERLRVFQGLGAGGLGALSQIVMADILSPRERGKYAGLFGAVMALATIGGPLLGGVVTDAFGWRWNFFIGLPIGRVQNCSLALKATLSAAATGILLFLFFDVLEHGVGPVEDSLNTCAYPGDVCG